MGEGGINELVHGGQQAEREGRGALSESGTTEPLPQALQQQASGAAESTPSPVLFLW